MATEHLPRRRVRRVLFVAAVGVPLLLAGTVAYFYIGYRWRLARGFRRVDEVRQIATESGGFLIQGLVNGTFYLHMEGTSLTDRQLAEIAARLKEFPPPYLDQEHVIEAYLSGTNNTDQGIASLSGIRRLSGLDLSDTRVTDAGVKSLRGLQLGWIALRNTSATDEAIPTLASMRWLGRVDLENTAVSPAGLQQLADALPYWPEADPKAQYLMAKPPTER